MAGLGPLARAEVGDHAAFLGFEAGVLRLAVRTERYRARVQDHLRDIDLPAAFPGFRQLLVQVDSAGQTGRERRSERDAERLVEARRAAEQSPAVQALLRAFGGQILAVEPPPAVEVDPDAEPAPPEAEEG